MDLSYCKPGKRSEKESTGLYLALSLRTEHKLGAGCSDPRGSPMGRQWEFLQSFGSAISSGSWGMGKERGREGSWKALPVCLCALSHRTPGAYICLGLKHHSPSPAFSPIAVHRCLCQHPFPAHRSIIFVSSPELSYCGEIQLCREQGWPSTTVSIDSGVSSKVARTEDPNYRE